MTAPKTLILIVDDEAHVNHVVSLKLRNGGYDVITAQDGEEGLALALDRVPDLVITDYQMPFLSGLDLCEQLKQDPSTAHVPALLLTARGFNLSSDALKKTNITEVFSKPFSPKEILEAVRRIVGNEPAQPPAGGMKEITQTS